jgi:hypothetical protein
MFTRSLATAPDDFLFSVFSLLIQQTLHTSDTVLSKSRIGVWKSLHSCYAFAPTGENSTRRKWLSQFQQLALGFKHDGSLDAVHPRWTYSISALPLPMNTLCKTLHLHETCTVARLGFAMGLVATRGLFTCAPALFTTRVWHLTGWVMHIVMTLAMHGYKFRCSFDFDTNVLQGNSQIGALCIFPFPAQSTDDRFYVRRINHHSKHAAYRICHCPEGTVRSKATPISVAICSLAFRLKSHLELVTQGGCVPVVLTDAE